MIILVKAVYQLEQELHVIPLFLPELIEHAYYRAGRENSRRLAIYKQ